MRVFIFEEDEYMPREVALLELPPNGLGEHGSIFVDIGADEQSYVGTACSERKEEVRGDNEEAQTDQVNWKYPVVDVKSHQKNGKLCQSLL